MKSKILVITSVLSIFLVFASSCKDKPENNTDTNVTLTDSTNLSADDDVEEVENLKIEENIDNKVQDHLKSQMEKVLKACNDKQYGDLALLMAYRGKDKTRMWKDHFNMNQANEKFSVEYTGKTIREWQKGSTGKTFGDFVKLTDDSGVEWFVQKVDFNKASGSDTKYFYFVNVKDEYLLGEIDSKLTGK